MLAFVANLYAYALAWNAGVNALAEQFTRRGIFGPVFQSLFISMIGPDDLSVFVISSIPPPPPPPWPQA